MRLNFNYKMFSVAACSILFWSSVFTDTSVAHPQVISHLNDRHGDFVSTSVELLERTTKQIKLRVIIANEGRKSVLIVTDPFRMDGSSGPYLSFEEANPLLLKVSFAVFPPPAYTIYAPKNRVTYRPLEPGTTYETTILLVAPLLETKPPWGRTWHTRTLDISEIQELIVRVGVLPDEASIREAFARDRAPTGLEMVQHGALKGKSLFEIQTIVASNRIKL